MNREERERLVDRLLNEALAPPEVEPRAGLENRILANLRAQPERRWSWRWLWVPAVAALLIALAVGLRMSSRPQPASPAAVIEHQPVPSAAKTVSVPTQHATARRGLAPTASGPKRVVVAKLTAPPEARQEVFPSPVPLTPEEQMLMGLVRQYRPEAELVANNQQYERERIQAYFETGEASALEPVAAPITR